MTAFPSGLPAPSAEPKDENKFRLVTLAFQRCKQLQHGARPRVEPGDHKSQRIAMLEVMAGTISWSLTAKPERGPA
jgi:DNA-directed RNA polymerase omega subunit